MLTAVVARRSPFGRVILISGPEALLAERALAEIRRQILDEAPDVEVAEIEATRLDGARLLEVTSPSLFSNRSAAVITDAAELTAELAGEVLALARTPVPDLALVVVHGGGQKGKAVLDGLRKAGAEVIDCPPVKTWELPQLVAAEARAVWWLDRVRGRPGLGRRGRPRPAGAGLGGAPAAGGQRG